jgi:cell shape-determining protein MreD
MKWKAWVWRPAFTRWIALGLGLLWYGVVGPLGLGSHPWLQVDLVRPWLVFESHWAPPGLIFWLGAAWGIVQDILTGQMLGLYGLVWGTEALLIVYFRLLFNFPTWLGSLTGLSGLLAFQYGALFLLTRLLGLTFRPDPVWALIDGTVNVLLVRLAFFWWERAHYEAYSAHSV